jgi:hypothetical protein
MLTVSLLLQLGLVNYIHGDAPPRILAKELLVTFFCLKPAQDAIRIVRGNKQQDHAKIEPVIEMMTSKLIEIFTEAIPGAVIQTAAILTTGKVTKTAIASIFFSVCATAFTSSALAFDYDIDPANRKKDPKWHGYVPPGGLGVFTTMIGMSACVIFSQALSYSLMFILCPLVLIGYLLFTIVIFITAKSLRGNLYIRKFDSEILIGWLIFRAIGMIVTDFTEFFLSIYPMYMGGAGFTVNLFMKQLGTLAVVKLFIHFDGNTTIDVDLIWMAMLAANAGVAASFSLFLFKIEKGYAHLFFEVETVAQEAVRTWREISVTPAEKLSIFKCPEHYYDEIRKEVRKYVTDNIQEWENSNPKPEWWNDEIIRHIPQEFLTEAVRKRTSARNSRIAGGRRRSSLVAAKRLFETSARSISRAKDVDGQQGDGKAEREEKD